MSSTGLCFSWKLLVQVSVQLSGNIIGNTWMFKKFALYVWILFFSNLTVCALGDEITGSNIPKNLRDIVGASHVDGKYFLSNNDFLNEGADQILTLGSRVIKVWFYGKRAEPPKNVYSFNSNWSEVSTLAQGAALPYFKTLFNKPFSTYILVVTSLGREEDYWRNGITDEQAADETKQFYELTKYLLNEYKDTNKTFILQHWEGDWMVRDKVDPDVEPKEEALKNMVKWLKARQRGVTKARNEVGCHGVHVYHAAEVNRVLASMQHGKPNMVNKVLPFTKLDLVSYSAWDTAVDKWQDPNLFGKAIDFIAQNMVATGAFESKHCVYIGEFGWPENMLGKEHLNLALHNITGTTLERGCPYIVYWQVYCNDKVDRSAKLPIKENNQMQGFWLIRPDGTKSYAWQYFNNLLSNNNNEAHQDMVGNKE